MRDFVIVDHLQCFKKRNNFERTHFATNLFDHCSLFVSDVITSQLPETVKSDLFPSCKHVHGFQPGVSTGSDSEDGCNMLYFVFQKCFIYLFINLYETHAKDSHAATKPFASLLQKPTKGPNTCNSRKIDFFSPCLSF